jgi:hypothetical protein
MNHENVLSERGQSKKTTYGMMHLSKMPSICKSIDIEGRLVLGKSGAGV